MYRGWGYRFRFQKLVHTAGIKWRNTLPIFLFLLGNKTAPHLISFRIQLLILFENACLARARESALQNFPQTLSPEPTPAMVLVILKSAPPPALI